MSLTLTIAGHTIRVEGDPEAEILRRSECFAPFVTERQPEWRIRFVDSIEWPEYQPLHTFYYDETVLCRFGRSGGSYLFEMDGAGSTLRLRCQPGSPVECSRCGDSGMLRFGVWMAYSLCGMGCDALPIHASTILWGGKAVLFLGESGTGKSTHTRLWLRHIEGSSLLNDDSPILTIEQGRAMVYGSPWSGKTPCYRPFGVPVAAIVRLRQAPANHIERLSTIRSIAALCPSLPPALAHDEEGFDCQMSLIEKVIGQVPIYQLDCLPDEEAAQLSHHTIFHPSL